MDAVEKATIELEWAATLPEHIRDRLAGIDLDGDCVHLKWHQVLFPILPIEVGARIEIRGVWCW